MNIFYLSLMVLQAVMMLFMLRALMQTANTNYYHPFTQSVIKLTSPVLKFMPFNNLQFRGFYYAGFLVAAIFALAFWLVIMSFFNLPFAQALIFTVICEIKTFGYLVLALLFVQALTSWLPSTRQISFFLASLTDIFVRPVQRIVPPVGMIDLSLMVVILAIYALNIVFAHIFGLMWQII